MLRSLHALRTHARLKPLALAIACAGATPFLAATAQAETVAAAQHSYAIPAGPLNAVLNRFAAESGTFVAANGALTEGKSSPGVRGHYTAAQAIDALLEGTGLAAVPQADGSYALAKSAPAAALDTQLRTVDVKADDAREDPAGSVHGYVARRSLTATKTDTPLRETPQSISIVTRDQMDAQNVQSVSDALRYTAGVAAEANGPDPRSDFINIRGFDADGRSSYRDGLRQFAFNGQGGLVIETYGLERVEILRGPSSVLYGQGGVGGVMNLVTKRPTATALHEVRVQAGSYDRYEAAADFGGALDDDGEWLYRLTGLARDSDTQIDYVTDDRRYIAPALTWQPSDATSLTLLADYQKNERGQGYQALPRLGTLDDNPTGKTIHSNRFVGEPGFERFDQNRYSVSYLFEHRFNDQWAFRQNARYLGMKTFANTIYEAGFVETAPDVYDYRTIARQGSAGRERIWNFVVDNQVQVDWQHGDFEHTSLLGVDSQRLRAKSGSNFVDFPALDIFDPVYGQPLPVDDHAPADDTKDELEQVGIYLQDQMKIAKKWVVTLGGRHDSTEKTTQSLPGGSKDKQKDDAFTWRVGTVYLADNGFAPYASYSESFLPIVDSDAQGKAFDPETGKQYEVGVRYQPDGSNLSVTGSLFDARRRNLLTADPNNPQYSVQRGEVRVRGAELEAKASWDSGLDVVFAYSYNDPKITRSNDGYQGNVPNSVPKHIASLWGDYAIHGGAMNGVSLGAGVRYTGSSYGDDDNTLDVPGRTLVDARVQYDFGALSSQFAGLSAMVSASNLFDREYVATCGYYADGCKYGYRRMVIGSLRYLW